jgi:hypothetical protein
VSRPHNIIDGARRSVSRPRAGGFFGRFRFGRFRFGTLLALVCAGAAPRIAEAQEDAPRRMHLLTLGPGDHPFFKFGHNALWLEGPGGGPVFNWGTFAFDTPALIPKFIQGRFKYWLSVAPIEQTVPHYVETNRTVVTQALALTAGELADLERTVAINARPENREYLYDYFIDNCSTRVRDALDGALGGKLKPILMARPGRMTYRQHALRLTADVLWEYVALDFVLSGRTDRPITEWDEGFIPQVLRESVRTVKIDRGQGPVALVDSERSLFEAQRPPELTKPPVRWPYFALAGVLGGVWLVGLGRLSAHARAARVALGMTLAVVGLVCGFLGAFMLYVWGFTNHRFSYANENILLVPPWLLAWLALGVAVALGKPRMTRLALRLAVLTVAVAMASVILKVLPWFSQDNWSFVVFFMPLWVGAALGLRAVAKTMPAAR